jgi:Tfp pilus assembly protein PilN
MLSTAQRKALNRMILTVISIVLACAAFLFSIFTWRERRSQDQRDLFLKRHERLIDIDLQHGRRILAQSIRSTKDAQSLLNRLNNSSPIAMSGVRPILMGLGRIFKHLRRRLACPLLHV